MKQRKRSLQEWTILIIKIAFWALLVSWVLICIIVGLRYKEDFRFDDRSCRSFNQGWVLVEDGITPVEIPGNELPDTATVRIRNVIPQKVDDRTSIMIKGLHQDIRVWINGELVGTLDNSDTRPFGRHTPSAYIRIPLRSSDAGKQIEIQYSAPTPEEAGKLNDIRIGTDIGLLFWMMNSYGTDVIFAILLLYTGIVIVLLGIAMRIGMMDNPNMNIVYLGVSAICIAVWMLGESRLRQFYYGNLVLGEVILWEALFLAPIPMIFYISRLQERRYTKEYMVLVVSALIANVLMLVLELTNVLDFYDTYPIGWGIIIAGGTMVLYTIFRDWRKGIHQWKLLTGIVVLMVCVLMQMWGFEHSATGIFTNDYISFGLILFMLIMGISAITSIWRQKQEQVLAVKSSETKSNFLANMSHEIRTPINAMLGFDELILREETDEQIIEYATNIKKAGSNLLSLINDVLDFSKVESGKTELVNGDYKTSAMLTDVINMTYMKAQDKGLSFDIFIGKDIPRVLYGDEIRVKQILTNVLNNAVKYTETGSVTLSVNFDQLGGKQGRLRVSVADTGIGIKQENIEKITESFQRFDLQHNRSIEGTGLGMSIVSHLLDIMGGKLQIYSTYGKGSDFRMLIPQEIRDATPMGSYQTDYKKDLRSQAGYHELFTAPQARILFVDDNYMNLTVARGLLKKTKIQIDLADSGVGCLELTRKNKYDLIFMDHLMPEMDGIETLHRLRREEGNPNQYTMVIALTANAIKGSKELYLSEGFHAYLSKPIEGEKLEEVLLKLLPKEYIIPSEESAENVLSRLEQDQTGKLIGETPKATVVDCMRELENLLEQAHIQVADGYYFAGNSMGQFHWLITLFAESFFEKYQKLLEYFNGQQEDMYTIEVHALKSNAKGIGARQLYQLAWEHEQQSRSGNWNYVQTHWEELCQEWICVVDGILNYIGEEPVTLEEAAATEESGTAGLAPQQQMLLENAITLIGEYEDDGAIAILENLLQEDLPEETKNHLNQCIQELKNLNFDGAVESLKIFG